MERFDYKPDLFPRLSRVGAFLGRVLRFNPTSGYPSSHEHRGASEALDAALYDNVTPIVQNRWDSEGNWANQPDDAA